MKILVDVMGGDNAPDAAVIGALDAAKSFSDLSVTMIGDEDAIHEAAAKAGRMDELESVGIVHTAEVITMEDPALSIVRVKTESSMAVGLKMLSEGRGDAFISAGNTGALHAGSSLIVRRIRGIQRSAIATVLPFARPVLLIDSGANIEVEPSYLRQFAIMGSIYMSHIFGVENPEVGLLNNGTESTKGTKKLIEAHDLLEADESINFVGNVEGKEVPFGKCDVIVTDGFTGNVFLKLTEGLGSFLLSKLKDCFYENILTKASALLLHGSLKKMKNSFSVSEYGGAPLLGLSKPVIKAHGSSDARAFTMAIRRAADFAETGITVEIAKWIEEDRCRKESMQNVGAASEASEEAEELGKSAEKKSVLLSETEMAGN